MTWGSLCMNMWADKEEGGGMYWWRACNTSRVRGKSLSVSGTTDESKLMEEHLKRPSVTEYSGAEIPHVLRHNSLLWQHKELCGPLQRKPCKAGRFRWNKKTSTSVCDCFVSSYDKTAVTFYFHLYESTKERACSKPTLSFAVKFSTVYWHI
jgi:hypothetical protein